MRKLLRADFRRLFASRTFWLCMAGMVVFSAALLFDSYNVMLTYVEEKVYIEDALFNYPPLLGFVLAAVAGMAVGADYADGTIRNKLISGSERRRVYLSHLIVSCAAGALLAIVFIVPMLAVGLSILDGFASSTARGALLIAASFLGIMANAAIAAAVSLGFQNRTAAVLVSLALMAAMLFAASYVNARLDEQEMTYSPIIITMDDVADIEQVPNPNYIDSTKRIVYQWIDDILPAGQAIQLADGANPEHTERWPFTAALVALLASGIGYAVFKRKDIQ